MTEEDLICGIIGRRLAHSLTPKLMNHLAVINGHDERFRPFEVSEDEIPNIIEEFRHSKHVCMNVTSPYKETVIPHLDSLSGDATDAHAVNVIIGEQGSLKGYNADIQGFLSPVEFLKEVRTVNEERNITPTALILGSGGASAAVAVGLTRVWGEGRIVFAARNLERLHRRVDLLARTFPEYPMEITAADSIADALGLVFQDKQTTALLVNTTPIGQWPDAGDSPFDIFNLKDDDLVDFGYYYDAVYNPMRTTAMKHMESIGAKVVGGVDWFCRQASLSAELFFGKRASEDELRRFVEEELQRTKSF